MPLAKPSVGPISQAGRFGQRTLAGESTTFHGGLDYVGAVGSPIRAVKEGTVVVAAPNGTYNRYGNLVVIKHDDPTEAPYSLYAHLNSLRVRKGQKVRAGQLIGTMGNTAATADEPKRTVRTHLHFELLKNFPAPPDVGRIDPSPYLINPAPKQNPYVWTSPQQYASDSPLLYSDVSPMLSGLGAGLTLTRCGPESSLSGTRWTSNNVAPFSRAPGAGLRGLAPISGQPGLFRRRPSTTDFESGFAADPVGSGTMEPDILVLGQGPFTVKRQAVAQGEVPSALIQFYYTDRGTLTKARLDKDVADLLKKNGFKVSRATRFEPISVTWRWQHEPDFYYPVVATPSSLAGMRYAGNALQLPVYTQSAADLAKVPTQIYVYTLAVTTDKNTMTDADAARVLTQLRQAMVGMDNAKAYANVHVTTLGSSPDVFGDSTSTEPLSPVVKAGISSLILVAAVQLLSSHVGAGS